MKSVTLKTGIKTTIFCECDTQFKWTHEAAVEGARVLRKEELTPEIDDYCEVCQHLMWTYLPREYTKALRGD